MNAHSRFAAALAAVVLSLAAASDAADRAPGAPAPHPAQTAPAKPVQPTRMIMLPVVTVDTPNAGETLGLDGSVVQIVFSAKHLDSSKSFSYMPELLRNGAALGPIFNTGFVLNPKKDKEVVGAYRGHYLVGYKDTLATPGGGYQYRITVYEGQWGAGHKVVVTGVSPTFSFGPPPPLAGPATITVASPAAGSTFSLDGSVLQIPFSAKNFDPNKSFSYMPELLRNGAALGPIFNTGFVLNPKKDPEVIGVYRGHYLASNKDMLATPGGGYQYRIIAYEGQWGAGHKVVASGVSPTFSFSPPPPLAGPATITVATPAAGVSLSLGGPVLQIPFSAKNFDPNKSFSYMPELLRNGVALGPIFNTGFVLNPKKDPEVVGVYRGHYIADNKDALATPGGGYQYRITVYEGQWGAGHTVVTSGVSGSFTFSP